MCEYAIEGLWERRMYIWEGMVIKRILMPLVALLLTAPIAFAQKIDEGLWNAGRVFTPVPARYADSLAVQSMLARVQLYPGFSVVRSDLQILNKSSDTLYTPLLFTDSASTAHPFFNRIANLPSVARMVLAGSDTLADVLAPIRFAPGQTTISVLEITPNHQALLSRDGSVKEANTFVFSLPPSPFTSSRVLIELKGGLSLTNILGIHPDSSVLATMTQLALQKGTLQKSTELVIWYDGAPPDMKFDKKVLPLAQQLYAEMDKFNMAMFDSPEFKPHEKNDFSVNKRSPFFSFLYFLMFTVPWILLIGFMAWLVFKPKKKKES